jgi:hypothetical protein
MDLSPAVRVRLLTLRLTAYTIYAFFEWSLILFDVGFDAITAFDFAGLELKVVDVNGTSKGYVGLPQWNRDD